MDDVGYLSSATLLDKPAHELMALIEQMRHTRYQGWRNHKGLWRDLMGLDEPGGRDVLDLGCGNGVESLEIARAGNRVSIADIADDNLRLAARVLSMHARQTPHQQETDIYLVMDEAPYISAKPVSFDTVHCSGVLHHIPWARQVMQRVHDLLRPDGTVRLMVYSDRGWQQATGSSPPEGDVRAHPDFERFVRHFDQVGEYADWYSRDRMQTRFGDLFTIERCEYLTPTGQYLGAVLRKKEATG